MSTRTRRSGFRLAVALVLALAAVAGSGGPWAQLLDPPPGWDMWNPAWTNRDTWVPDPGDQALRGRMNRHSVLVREGVPAPYRDARNPLPSTPKVLRDGGRLYVTHCARCHDPAGMGGGDAGLALYPSPALLAELIRMPDAVDAYLLWAIVEGGRPFGTAMPAFEQDLDREQIWQIVTYMRAGFPPLADAGSR